MDSRQKNQAAFKRVKPELANRYPPGWFVAFDDGEIVADAATFDDLTAALAAIGKDRPDILVVQAGVNYPEEVFILI
jgi:hypothetical protein